MGTRFPTIVFEYRKKNGGILHQIPAHTIVMKIWDSSMMMTEKGSYSIHRFFYPERHFIIYKGDTAVGMSKYEKNAFKIFNELVEDEQNGSSKGQRLRRSE